jgi:ribose/xylose/arabinose/galactoside ABC-type transport system permease subunit
MTTARLAALAQRHGALTILLALLLFGGTRFTTFLTGYNLGNLAVQASFLTIIALGMTLVIVTGGIDLSVGSVYALCGVMAAYASRWGALAALAVPLAAGALIGLAQGWLIGRLRMPPFIVTLGGLLFARGLLQFLTNEGQETYTVPRDSKFLWLGQGTFLGIGVPVFIALALYLVGGLLLQRTPFGLRLFSIGGSEDASVIMGLPVARTKVTVYVLSGLLAALAGAMTTGQLGSGVTTVGAGLELEAISAVVIGGTLLTGGSGTVSGTLAGVALLWVIRDLINQIGGITSTMQAVVSGAILLIVVVAQTLLTRAHHRSPS